MISQVAHITKKEAQRLVNKFASQHFGTLPTLGQEFVLFPYGSKVTVVSHLTKGNYRLVGYREDGKDVSVPLAIVRTR